MDCTRGKAMPRHEPLLVVSPCVGCLVGATAACCRCLCRCHRRRLAVAPRRPTRLVEALQSVIASARHRGSGVLEARESEMCLCSRGRLRAMLTCAYKQRRSLRRTAMQIYVGEAGPGRRETGRGWCCGGETRTKHLIIREIDAPALYLSTSKTAAPHALASIRMSIDRSSHGRRRCPKLV